MTEILGFETAIDERTLAQFLASAHQAYQKLEEAITPIDKQIADVQKDWDPRLASFWKAALQEIQTTRSAAADCINLFDCEQSQEVPVPIIISATSIAYLSGLHNVNAKIEEAGILLTAYIQSSGSPSIEKDIRERQRLLWALKELSEAVHKAANKARAKLNEAPEVQRQLLVPTPAKLASKKSAKANRTRLHIVGEHGQEPEEDQV